jgi:hypothetical protein
MLKGRAWETKGDTQSPPDSPTFAAIHSPPRSSEFKNLKLLALGGDGGDGGADPRAPSLDRTPHTDAVAVVATDAVAVVARVEIMAALRAARPSYPEAKLKVRRWLTIATVDSCLCIDYSLLV